MKRILVVDDRESDRELQALLLGNAGYEVLQAAGGALALQLAQAEKPSLIIADILMPEIDGYELARSLRDTPTTAGIPVILCTATYAIEEVRRLAAACGVERLLIKPCEPEELLRLVGEALASSPPRMTLGPTMEFEREHLCAVNAALLKTVRALESSQRQTAESLTLLEHRTWELERARLEAFQKLALAAEYRDDETRQHTQRVGRIAAALAAEMGFEPDMVQVIGEVAPLHDLGKIGIPDAILLKPGKLTDEEAAAMREHAQIGANIMAGSSSPLFEVATDIARTHHERWDGSGYPLGVAGQAIPLTGRIVALADAFDAMSHDRPYKKAMAIDETIAEIDRCSGSHFDPAVVEALHRLDFQTLRDPVASSPPQSLTHTAWEALREFTAETDHGSTAATDALLEMAFDATPLAALIVDDERRYVTGNTVACRTLGVSLDELRQLRIDDFAPPEARPQMDATWEQFMSDGVQNAEFTMVLRDGTRLDISYRGMAHFLPGRHLSLIEPLRRSDESGTRYAEAS